MDAPTNPDIHGLHLDAAHKALSSARAAAAVGYWRTCSIETRRALLAAGCEVLTYRGDELSLKAEGGPTCLTRALVRG